MRHSYDGICFDLFGTLVDGGGSATVGAAALLERLAGSRIAIVTSAPRRSALRLLYDAQLRVAAVMICGDDVQHGKPAPDPYALAVAQLAIAAPRALAVEDSASGVRSAKAAGLDAAFVLNGRLASVCPQADFYLKSLRRLTAEPDGNEIAVEFD